MKITIEQRRQAEIEKEGLVIIRAYYGHLASLPDFPGTLPIISTQISTEPLVCTDQIIDVTDQLQYHVDKSELHLGSYPKHILPGFYDPCTGSPNYLDIYFSLSGQIYRTIIDDKGSLHIPFIKYLDE